MSTTTRKRQRPKVKPEEAWHGTVNGYQWHGCRCAACTHAMTSYQASYRTRRFEGKGCAVRGCRLVASKAAGNGLCYKHHAEKKARQAKRSKKSRGA